MLSAADLAAPYVLVGSSGGGYLAAEFTLQHREDVDGLLILDTFPALDPKTAPPEVLAEIKCDSPDNQERRDYLSIEHAAWDNRQPIPGLRLTVITNRYGSEATNADERNSVKGQRGWLVLNPEGKQVVVTSGHEIPQLEPELVIKEISAVVAASR